MMNNGGGTTGTAKTVIVSESCLLREGLKSLLRGTAFEAASEAGTVDGLRVGGRGLQDGAIVLLDAGAQPSGLAKDIRRLTGTFDGVSVVVLADTVEAEALFECLEAGAAGYLLKDVSSEVLVASLGVVREGQKVFSAETLSLVLDRAPGAESASYGRHPLEEISARERQILACLVDGASNKAIARHLHITEATVKVHLRSLMRKTDCRNRTQAAIWGIRNGVTTRVAMADAH